MGADVQLYRHFIGIPAMRNIAGLATYIRGEIGALGTVTVALVGGTPRTYRALGTNVLSASVHSGADAHSVLMIWE
jgi:hypothetical protein